MVREIFLGIMILLLWYRDVSKIQRFWLPDKSESEIKHRYKNWTCAKAEPNIIKTWKQANKESLTAEEKELLKKGVEWFGDTNRWSLINKWFLPDRSQQFLINAYFNNDKKDSKKQKLDNPNKE